LYFELTLVAYIIDYIFGEFSKMKYLKHPIIFMGDYIKWFEKRFYKDNIYRGLILTLSLICIVLIITFTLTKVDNVIFQAFLASFTISSKMLYESVQNVIVSDNPKYAISMLVSRDTNEMNESDINKAAIETYAENLSDGVIAPLFYLLCFGLVGAFVYKAINTLDSMVGYRNERYERFGKFSARVDDIVNFIPSRIAAILIALLFLSKKALLQFFKYGKKHESLNAGLPISAMALALDIKLGGPTSYFGKIKQKPYFGDGKENIEKIDVKKALAIKPRLDIFILSVLFLFTIFSY